MRPCVCVSTGSTAKTLSFRTVHRRGGQRAGRHTVQPHRDGRAAPVPSEAPPLPRASTAVVADTPPLPLPTISCSRQEPGGWWSGRSTGATPATRPERAWRTTRCTSEHHLSDRFEPSVGQIRTICRTDLTRSTNRSLSCVRFFRALKTIGTALWGRVSATRTVWCMTGRAAGATRWPPR